MSTCERFRDEDGVCRREHHRPNQDGLVGAHGFHAGKRLAREVESRLQGVLEFRAEEIVGHLDGVSLLLDAEEFAHLFHGEHWLQGPHDQGITQAVAVIALFLLVMVVADQIISLIIIM